MSTTIVRSALEGRLKVWAAARVPALPVAWQNAPFDPPADGGVYLRAFTMPATTDSEDLAGVMRAYTGVFQISIVAAAGSGTTLSNAIADELAALFPNNLPLIKSGLSVYVRTPCSTSASIADDTTSTTPVSFSYRADTV
ncbi:MAG: DUF4128 domain-containing protein [Pseudomonadaceae bacterium]|nr:DUF4128 domain-containing protein [Pseudomonadaceae bacterium]